MELKKYCPIFHEDVHNYEKPTLLRIVKYDKRMDVDVCKGAVGFEDKVKSERVFHLYQNSAEQQGITLYPYVDDTVYYKNPYENDSYIALEEYFSYIKKSKVSELKHIAQCLGAKSFEVVFKEQKKSLTTKVVDADAQVQALGKGKVHHASNQNEFCNVEIASKSEFSGTDKIVKPKLLYFSREKEILDLINTRMNNTNPLHKETFRFECATNRDMSSKTAANIDVILKTYKCNGNTSVESEYQMQKRTILEYTIEF